MTWAVRIDDRGRITLPKELLKILGLKPGDLIAFVKEENGPVYVGRAKLQIEVPFLEKKIELEEEQETE